MDDAEQLMPTYLRFVRGVIDSNDLPLNVSREIVQESKVVEAIRAGSVKRVLSLLEEVSENDKDKYVKVGRSADRVLKEGVGEDYANTERIAKLLRLRASGGSTPDAMQLPIIRRTRVFGCILPALIAPPTSSTTQFDLLEFSSEA
jgi:molecular chaperone HtpG